MTYVIRQSSPLLFVISMLTTIFSGMAILISLKKYDFLPEGVIPFLVLFVPITILAFKLQRYTATVDIELEIDQVGLKKRWIKQFPFQNRPNIEINWPEIKNYVFEPDRQFDKFKITLKDGSKFKFFHNNDYNDKDDFIAFVNDFKIKIDEINTSSIQFKAIERGKTIYETTWGLIFACIAIIIIIGLPVILIMFPTKKTPNYATIGASYMGAIYFIFQVYIHRRQNKAEIKKGNS